MTGSRGWVWWLVGVLLILAGGATAAYVVVLVPEEREANRDMAAAGAVRAVAEAWQDQDVSGLGDDVDYTAVTTGLTPLTDDSEADGDSASNESDPQPVWPESVTVGDIERTDASATATLTVTWPFGSDGWTYDTTVTATQAETTTDPGSIRGAFDTSGGQWQADFAATAIHPSLGDGAVLAAERDPATRGDVLDRSGEPLITERAVVDIGVQPSAVPDIEALAATLADVLGIDAAGLVERVQAAGPDDFVLVITLRREDYDPVRDEVRTQEGVRFRETTLPLAPTSAFARATLGRAGQATAEIIEASEGRVLPGDVVGLSGLQRQYDEHLAGQAGFSIVTRSGEQSSGLFTEPGSEGADLALTLDRDIQVAADQALAGVSAGNGNAALVAIDVPTGDIVAVANTPTGGADRALTGTYPPGSTFKAVSTLALLDTGLTPDETVPCPQTATVQGRDFGNAGDSELGAVPFSTDFAQSCNTAFVALSSRLGPDDLTETASTVGLGGQWTIGTQAATGSVPPTDSAVGLAAASIGQGQVLASPMAMAQVAATIAGGSWTPPRLVTLPEPEAGEPPPALDAEAAATVRELMREVVTDGSASDLADVPGEPVHAKTGTAEFGTETPPGTHAWVIGFQDDLAFAVLVEEGGSGSGVAVPAAETFLRLLQ